MKKRSTDEASERDLAKSMRKLCAGKFGSMGKDEYNHRALGTKGEGRGK